MELVVVDAKGWVLPCVLMRGDRCQILSGPKTKCCVQQNESRVAHLETWNSRGVWCESYVAWVRA